MKKYRRIREWKKWRGKIEQDYLKDKYPASSGEQITEKSPLPGEKAIIKGTRSRNGLELGWYTMAYLDLNKDTTRF
jgi:hypothetical protein